MLYAKILYSYDFENVITCTSTCTSTVGKMSFLIWFQLADSTGKPYKNTSAAKVYIPSTADVYDFCMAVQAAYDGSHLGGVAPSDLIVYENKAALDLKISLKSSEPLTGLGKDVEDNVVFVVVPSLPGAPLMQQAGFDTQLEVACCKLSTEFLIEFKLHSYITAAAICAKDNCGKSGLARLETDLFRLT
jgi:hypothetical protein